jgi:hypothetical protein
MKVAGMNRRMVLSAAVAAALTVTSCGGSGSGASTSGFSDQVAGVCRTIGRGIGNLDAATSLDQVRSNATDASGLFEDGINALKKLTIPTSDKQFASDAKDLISSFEDQLDTLDAIAKSAKDGDQAAVDTKIGKLTKEATDGNDLADSLGISRCQLDPVFAAAPPTTEPNVPLTLPIATVPAETIPLDTFPPPTTFTLDTLPLGGNKQIITSADLVPLGNYTFADAPDTAITGFKTLLELAPSMASQSGRISGIDVIDSSGKTMGRVFAFESDTNPLPAGSFEEVSPYFTNSVPTTPKTVGTLQGVTWTDTDGTAHFLLGVSNVVLWALSPTADLLVPTLQAWGESVSQ